MMPVGLGHGVRAEAGAPVNLNLDPIIPIVGRMITEVDLGNVFKVAIDCVDSNPLLNVSLVTLKCYPFVSQGENPLVQKFDNRLSCSMRYLEALVMGTASLVYNFVFGAFFSIISAVTLGQVKIIVDQMRKHWVHTALAAAAVGVSAAGIFSPHLGQKANIAAALAIAGLLTQLAQADVIGKLCRAYQGHKQELRAATLHGLGGDRSLFNREFVPLFDYLDGHLTEQVQTLPDLMEVVQGAGTNFPHIAPIATPGRIIEHLQQVLVG